MKNQSSHAGDDKDDAGMQGGAISQRSGGGGGRGEKVERRENSG